jgi:hypothetical protein
MISSACFILIGMAGPKPLALGLVRPLSSGHVSSSEYCVRALDPKTTQSRHGKTNACECIELDRRCDDAISVSQ